MANRKPEPFVFRYFAMLCGRGNGQFPVHFVAACLKMWHFACKSEDFVRTKGMKFIDDHTHKPTKQKELHESHYCGVGQKINFKLVFTDKYGL